MSSPRLEFVLVVVDVVVAAVVAEVSAVPVEEDDEEHDFNMLEDVFLKKTSLAWNKNSACLYRH